MLSCLPAGDKGNDILAVFKELIALKSAGQLNHTRYSQQMSKGYILILLGMLFDLLTLSDSKDSNTDALKSILIFCHENYTREISLDIVARNLHMNKYYVSHLFNGKLKISLSDYINKLRITDACRFLTETTDCITKIAYKSGFSSLRSFNRHFQRITGFTPMNYRKAYQNEKGAS